MVMVGFFFYFKHRGEVKHEDFPLFPPSVLFLWPQVSWGTEVLLEIARIFWTRYIPESESWFHLLIDLVQVMPGLNLNSFINKMGMILSTTWIKLGLKQT